MRAKWSDHWAQRIITEYPHLDRPAQQFGVKRNATDACTIMVPTLPHRWRNEVLFILRTSQREQTGEVLALQSVRPAWRGRGGTGGKVYRRATFGTTSRTYTIVSYDCATAKLDYLESVASAPAARKALRTWARA